MSVDSGTSEDAEYRIEHDTMGEVRVPDQRAVARADPARGGELPDLRAAAWSAPRSARSACSRAPARR